MKSKNLFFERQNFMLNWIIGLFVVLILVKIYISGIRSFADFDWHNPGFWIALAVFVFLVSIRLRTRVDETGVYTRFIPFIWKEKHWSWDTIDYAYVRKYSLFEYGGWGLRIGGAGVAYTTRGLYGLQLVFKDGRRKVLIGTQKPTELKAVVEQFKRKAANA